MFTKYIVHVSFHAGDLQRTFEVGEEIEFDGTSIRFGEQLITYPKFKHAITLQVVLPADSKAKSSYKPPVHTRQVTLADGTAHSLNEIRVAEDDNEVTTIEHSNQRRLAKIEASLPKTTSKPTKAKAATKAAKFSVEEKDGQQGVAVYEIKSQSKAIVGSEGSRAEVPGIDVSKIKPSEIEPSTKPVKLAKVASAQEAAIEESDVYDEAEEMAALLPDTDVVIQPVVKVKADALKSIVDT